MSELGQFNRGDFDMGRKLVLTGPQVLSLVLPIQPCLASLGLSVLTYIFCEMGRVRRKSKGICVNYVR